MAADGTTTIRLPDGTEISLADWIDDRTYETVTIYLPSPADIAELAHLLGVEVGDAEEVLDALLEGAAGPADAPAPVRDRVAMVLPVRMAEALDVELARFAVTCGGRSPP